MDRHELSHWLRLTLTPGIGNASARKLLASFGLPEAIFTQSLSALRQVVSAAQAQALRQVPPDLDAQIQRTWDWLAGDPGADGGTSVHATAKVILTLADPRYPQALLATQDPPLMLYLHGAAAILFSGTAELPQHRLRQAPPGGAQERAQGPAVSLATALELGPSLAIVGSRNPTPQGILNARQFARTLAQEGGLAIVSGLALGIDGAAHAGALEARRDHTARPATIAVVGTGLDRVYPKAHHALARQIAGAGLLVSEYPIGTAPMAANFPRRNRIIAALSLGTLVVEATLRSGSLITARLAAEQGKEVFAIPGSIHSPQSRGCHALIRQGAKLVESTQDVLEELRLAPQTDTRARGADTGTQDRGISADPGKPHGALLQALGFDPVSLDALLARTGLPTATLQAQLMELELGGHVGRLPGGLFQRVAQG